NPQSCHFLNGAATPYYQQTAQVQNGGIFYYMSSRNNAFSNRSQKGVIIASGGSLLTSGAVAGIAIGTIGGLAGVGVAAVFFVKGRSGFNAVGHMVKGKVAIHLKLTTFRPTLLSQTRKTLDRHEPSPAHRELREEARAKEAARHFKQRDEIPMFLRRIRLAPRVVKGNKVVPAIQERAKRHSYLLRETLVVMNLYALKVIYFSFPLSRQVAKATFALVKRAFRCNNAEREFPQISTGQCPILTLEEIRGKHLIFLDPQVKEDICNSLGATGHLPLPPFRHDPPRIGPNSFLSVTGQLPRLVIRTFANSFYASVCLTNTQFRRKARFLKRARTLEQLKQGCGISVIKDELPDHAYTYDGALARITAVALLEPVLDEFYKRPCHHQAALQAYSLRGKALWRTVAQILPTGVKPKNYLGMFLTIAPPPHNLYLRLFLVTGLLGAPPSLNHGFQKAIHDREIRLVSPNEHNTSWYPSVLIGKQIAHVVGAGGMIFPPVLYLRGNLTCLLLPRRFSSRPSLVTQWTGARGISCIPWDLHPEGSAQVQTLARVSISSPPADCGIRLQPAHSPDALSPVIRRVPGMVNQLSRVCGLRRAEKGRAGFLQVVLGLFLKERAGSIRRKRVLLEAVSLPSSISSLHPPPSSALEKSSPTPPNRSKPEKWIQCLGKFLTVAPPPHNLYLPPSLFFLQIIVDYRAANFESSRQGAPPFLNLGLQKAIQDREIRFVSFNEHNTSWRRPLLTIGPAFQLRSIPGLYSSPATSLTSSWESDTPTSTKPA
ncbi:hypothetical protein BDK51DRAFT_27437, partial [Blyttiomyces helicus]